MSYTACIVLGLALTPVLIVIMAYYYNPPAK